MLFPLAAAPEDAQISGNSMDEIKQMIQTTGDKAMNLALLDNIKQRKKAIDVAMGQLNMIGTQQWSGTTLTVI